MGETMRATSIFSNDTRIIPAEPANQIKELTKNADGSLSVTFGDGRKGVLPGDTGDEQAIQAFAVWTMLNPDCTR